MLLNTILFSFLIFSLLIILMGIGYIFKGKCLAGTCGGLNTMFGKSACDACEEKIKCLDKLKE